MGAKDVILEIIFPALGGVFGLLMFLSPIKAVLRARKERSLGELNPLPMPALLANCIGWIGYACVMQNYYILWPNELGMLLGWFFTISCYGLAPTKTKDRQLAIMLFFAIILSTVTIVGSFVDLSQDGQQYLWGFTANAILVLYYTAPLSTVLTVVRTRNTASIYWPLSLMNCLNGSLWFGYGLAIGDYFIWVPNAAGALFGGCLLLLYLAMPSPKSRPTTGGCSGGDGGAVRAKVSPDNDVSGELNTTYPRQILIAEAHATGNDRSEIVRGGVGGSWRGGGGQTAETL